MKKLLLVLTLIIGGGFTTLNAQEEIQTLYCTMSVDEILMDNQPFGIDDPIAENAKHIVKELFAELKTAYAIIDEKQQGELKNSTIKISELLIQAEKIKMNLSMFDEDINYVDKIEKLSVLLINYWRNVGRPQCLPTLLQRQFAKEI